MNRSMPVKSAICNDINLGHPLRWILGLIVLGIFVYLILSGIYRSDDQPLRLVVYAFSTQEEVLTQGLFPAFEEAWETENDSDLVVEGVFGPSGTLSSQIAQGAPADIVIFSNQRHIDTLRTAKRINKRTQQVQIASTPLVIVTRPGNSQGLYDYTDLEKPGLILLHADPLSSGIGEWALLAEYGSIFLDDGNRQDAEEQLVNIWQNVRLVGSSAQSTLALFELGAGDALVTYEQQAYFARQRGIPLEVILPERTALAVQYAVVIDDNVMFYERALVDAFISFIQSENGQKILQQYYFRSATGDCDSLPRLAYPFTEEDLGGWSQVYDDLILGFWVNKIQPVLDLADFDTFLVRGE